MNLTSSDVAESGLLFLVTDTGIGLAPETLAKLFKPFTQGDPKMVR